MYRNPTCLILLLLLPVIAFGQVPQGVNYQAVIRDEVGEPIVSTPVDVELALRDGPNVDSPLLYREEFVGLSTDEYGVLQLVIGAGAAQGIPFFLVDWVNNQVYLDVIISLQDERIRLPSTRLQSTPYAVVAENVADPLWERGGGNSAALLGTRVGIGTTVPGESLSIEGEGEVGASLTSTNNGDVHLDLIRGTGDLGTDYRLVNTNGQFILQSARDGFVGETTERLRVTNQGNVGIGDASQPLVSLHLRGEGNRRLRVQSTDADAALEMVAPGADFRFVNDEGRLRFQRSFNNFVSSTDIFDVQTDNTLRFRQPINMADQPIVNTADPSGPQHVVTRRYLEDFVEDQLNQEGLFPKELSSETQNMTFDGCANRCRTLVEGGFSNWGVPSLDQLSQFAGGAVGDPDFIWTTTGAYGRYGYAHRINGGTFDPPPSITIRQEFNRFTMRLNTGDIDVATRSTQVNCRCVR